MLCDDIILDTQLPDLYDGLDRTFVKIKRAQKFVLSKEFAVAADGLIENYDELRKIVPYCRIPYPLTWIEWAFRDRPHWNPDDPRYGARPIDRSRHQMQPHRVGMLMQQIDRASHWKTHLFWSLVDKPVDGSRYNGSIQCIMMDTEAEGKDALIDAVKHNLAEFGQKFVAFMLEQDPSIGRHLLEYAIEDWGGEIRFMVAILGLLNTRNVAQHTTVDNEHANIKRARHGKRPLFSHTLLKIRPTLMVPKGSEGSGDPRDLRMHFVRGHFKHRKSGLFWWSTHVRGKLEHGAVLKDYEIEA
jgi:hypothetical protein